MCPNATYIFQQFQQINFSLNLVKLVEDYIYKTIITLHYIIIQLTPHWGFSVTEYYIKYYTLMLLTWPIYLSLQQLRYYFSNCVYPNPPYQL